MFARWFKVFPYEMLFHTTLTHVLTEPFTGEGPRDVGRVIDALASGRCYMAYHVAGDPKGFHFVAKTVAGERPVGSTVSLREKPELETVVPVEAEIRLIAAGRELSRVVADRSICIPGEAGPYRVEVRSDGRPWVFSGHIRITANGA
jgi:hypothetical protein